MSTIKYTCTCSPHSGKVNAFKHILLVVVVIVVSVTPPYIAARSHIERLPCTFHFQSIFICNIEAHTHKYTHTHICTYVYKDATVFAEWSSFVCRFYVPLFSHSVARLFWFFIRPSQVESTATEWQKKRSVNTSEATMQSSSAAGTEHRKVTSHTQTHTYLQCTFNIVCECGVKVNVA